MEKIEIICVPQEQLEKLSDEGGIIPAEAPFICECGAQGVKWDSKIGRLVCYECDGIVEL